MEDLTFELKQDLGSCNFEVTGYIYIRNLIYYIWLVVS